MKRQEFAAGEGPLDASTERPSDAELGKLLKQISRQVENDRSSAARGLFQIAERYEGLRQHLPPSELRVFLAEICGIAQSEVKAYASLLPVLGDQRDLLVAHGVAPEVVLKLVTAREDVRNEALKMIRSGRSVQLGEIAAIKRDLDHARLRADGALDTRRRSALARLVSARARRQATELTQDLEKFARRLLSWLDLPSFNPFVAPFEVQLAQDSTEAASLRRRILAIATVSELAAGENGQIWERALSSLTAIEMGRVADCWGWDPTIDSEHFAPEHRSEIAYRDTLIIDLARAAGFVIDPHDDLERAALRESRRHVLTEDHDVAVHRELTVLELCAGGGGQAIGLHAAGFRHLGLVEWKPEACATLSMNRPDWPVINADLRDVDYSQFKGVDLLAGGVPCQPFSPLGRRRGRNDERDMFTETLRIIETVRPKAIMLENVKGLFDAVHLPYRLHILETLSALGYDCEWREIQAPHFGMAQARARTILIGLAKGSMHRFRWPEPLDTAPKTVGETLLDLMAARGWQHAEDWAKKANGHCSTIIGASDDKQSIDLAMKQGRERWRALAVDPNGLTDSAPGPDAGSVGQPGRRQDARSYPRLTLRMVARLQGFPDEWEFVVPPGLPDQDGRAARRKVRAADSMPLYQQIANAFPAPLARVLGIRIKRALTGYGTNLGEALRQPYNIKRSRFDMRDAYRGRQAD